MVLTAFREGAMITIPELASEALGSYLAKHMGRRYGSTDAELIEIVQSAARLAIDCIGNSDALYHNVEHTMMVTLCGYDILTGRRLLRETNASDFAHVTVACLYHDIGYVRGILNDDSTNGYVIDAKGNKIELPRGSTDAALMPYHVDRSKLFAMHRLAKNKLLDATRVANAIESTRFPLSADDSGNEEGMLVRAADLTDQYPKFFWSSISPFIQGALRYLNVTSRGRQWIANLSFPKITSGRIDDAVQPRSELRRWRQTVGQLDVMAHPSAMPSACALDCNTLHRRKESVGGAPHRR